MVEISDLERAKKRLNGDISCIFLRGESVISSTKRGISPLIELLDSGRDLSGYSAADKIVGKAAALLYLCMGVSAVYGEVMTAEARELLTAHGIYAECAVLTQKIINRSGDGLCPMEETVQNISDPAAALPALKQKLESLKQ